jgi:phosphate-selective porin OprO/OprP
MIYPSLRHVYTTILSVSLLYASTLAAQEPADAEAVTTEEAAIKEETKEASANLRDAVNENLGSIQEDSQSVDDLKKEKKKKEDAVEIVEKPDPGNLDPDKAETETPAQAEVKKSFLERMNTIPAYLQSVPDRIPFIRDRGLIFFGRAELDYAHYSSGSAKNDSGFRVRSLRAGLANTYKYNISAKAEFDFTDGDSNFADLYARYSNKRWGLFTLGNQKVAQTLVNQTSRISRTFMEEPLPAEAFGLGRRLAVGWDLHKKKGGLHVTLFGPDLNGSIGDKGLAGRIYLNPSRSKLSVFHIGASYVAENMSRKTRFYSHPESRVTSERFVDTGIHEHINKQNIGALEIAGARKSFMFRGEFFRTHWQREKLNNPVFSGFYLQASWALTGESFNYVQGKFLRIRPTKPRGAWETAIRFSKVDLNDDDIKGGEEKNLSFAINWYSPGNQFRMMCNVILVKTDEFAGEESPTIFQLRGQFHW